MSSARRMKCVIITLENMTLCGIGGSCTEVVAFRVVQMHFPNHGTAPVSQQGHAGCQHNRQQWSLCSGAKFKAQDSSTRHYG